MTTSKKVAFGNTISEVLSNYVKVNNISGDFIDPMMDNAHGSIIPLFFGVNVELDSIECKSLLDLINHQISLWSPECHTPQSHQSAEGSRINTSNTSQEVRSIDFIEHVDGSLPINLLDNHHVTLYFFGQHRSVVEDIPEAVRNLLVELDPNYTIMYNNLTPYEYAVALIYRKFYMTPLPFESGFKEKFCDGVDNKPVTGPREVEGQLTRKGHHGEWKTSGGSEEDPSLVSVRLDYLVFVPDVVLSSVVSLEKQLISIPASEPIKVKRHDQSVVFDEVVTESAEFNEYMDEVDFGSSILVQEFHTTHITLGISKEFKPIVTNNICLALRNYLEYVKESFESGNELEIIRISHNAPPKKVTYEDIKWINIPWSGPSKYGDIRTNFIAKIPTLLNQIKERKNVNPEEQEHLTRKNEGCQPVRAENMSSFPLASPPEVHPAVSSSNYLSLKSNATPGDRGEDSHWTSSGCGLPVADLREAEGGLNREGHHGEWKTSGGTVDDSGKTSSVGSDIGTSRGMRRLLDVSRFYENVICYVSDDDNWVYFNRLPIDLGNDRRWLLDVYLIPLNKFINGRMRFYL